MLSVSNGSKCFMDYDQCSDRRFCNKWVWGPPVGFNGSWTCVEEPKFGPGLPNKTVYINGTLGPEHGDLQGLL